jgi:hypothetical protein
VIVCIAMGALRALLIGGVALLVAACGLLPGERPKLSLGNGTELVIVLFVNGQAVGEFPPEGPSPDIDESQLPPLPWVVEARTVSGRVLLTMTVEPGQIRREELPDGGFSYSGGRERIDLSCGTLWLWAGDITPGGPAPMPDAGEPGDCEP